MSEESKPIAPDGASVSGPHPLTEAEIAKGHEIWERIKDNVALSENEAATEPCLCRRVLLKPSWGGITDGATWINHNRTKCEIRQRPTPATDDEWRETEEARRVLFGAPDVDAATGALKAELESCRSRLSTAEKERAALEKLLSGVTAIQCDGCDRPVSVEWGPNDLRMIAPHVKHGVHGYVDPCPGSKLILLPAFAGDAAPAAPKTHDSSALEKALGALRAAVKWCHGGHGCFPQKQCGLCKPLLDALSGGAHVDGPKASPRPAPDEPAADRAAPVAECSSRSRRRSE